ncbi:hypothetical protein ACFU96_12220 [Streptomyces sp. NPDC057620]|uniref:hypothetical protein n=1 Tax=Streptomyces sp. NPDC057620 TaxID=3346185 RepID=UPI0036850459
MNGSPGPDIVLPDGAVRGGAGAGSTGTGSAGTGSAGTGRNRVVVSDGACAAAVLRRAKD